jgi:hypothetical protein
MQILPRLAIHQSVTWTDGRVLITNAYANGTRSTTTATKGSASLYS